jgi:hypothetical protein
MPGTTPTDAHPAGADDPADDAAVGAAETLIEDTWSDQAAQPPRTPEDVATEAAMREAEVAVVERRATDEQLRKVTEMAEVRSRADRRDVWNGRDPADRG